MKITWTPDTKTTPTNPVFRGSYTLDEVLAINGGPPGAPPEYQPERYCEACGAELVFELKQRGYNPTTGEPHTWMSGHCPKRRWWNGWGEPHA